MDWIERVFHVSPDGGNGSTEFLLVAIAMIVAALLSIGLVGHASRSRPRHLH